VNSQRILNCSLNRRELLGWSGVAAGALVLGFTLPVRARAAATATPINAFVSIDTTGVITVMSPFIEMGQGTYTAVAMLVAEEMDADMSAVRVVQAPHGKPYRIMFNGTQRFTGGSLSVREGFLPLRRAGAATRAMLMQAAAEQWRVPMSQLGTAPGVVIHQPTGRKLGYGELAARAAAQSVPEQVALKSQGQFRLIGSPVPRVDAAEKSTGAAEFGIDVHADGMLVAAVRHNPVWGERVRTMDAARAQSLPGFVGAQQVTGGVAAVADSYWHARTALNALKVEFDVGERGDFSSADYAERLRARLDDTGITVESEGDAAGVLRESAQRLQQDYTAPYLSHATLEPQNCAAQIANGRCIVWAPNQAADMVANLASKISGLPEAAVEVRTPYLGGGFGRRATMDYAAQAVELAMAYSPLPVKVLWSREEDMQHDRYRPMTLARYRAALGPDGLPLALHITNVGDGPDRHLSPGSLKDDIDESVFEGATGQPYAITHRRVDYVYEPSRAPLGYWRSVGNSINAFFKESFIDEMAHAVGRDPVEYRMALLKDQSRFRIVLETAAKMAGWRGRPWKAADGVQHAMGAALHLSFGSIVAQVAEVSPGPGGTPVVHRVWCAVDCGFAVNPLLVPMQVESAVAFGLSAALHEEIIIRDGRVTNANFDDYPILTPAEMPEVEVSIVNSGEALGGIGEVATPPIAPAVCNALFALTGRRIRSLPMKSLPADAKRLGQRRSEPRPIPHVKV
jgi:isoquinoline 1-oxidoreductase beta subunit